MRNQSTVVQYILIHTDLISQTLTLLDKDKAEVTSRVFMHMPLEQHSYWEKQRQVVLTTDCMLVVIEMLHKCVAATGSEFEL